MKSKEIIFIGVILLVGAILNYMDGLFESTYKIQIPIFLIIISYCFIVTLISLKFWEVLGIGIIAGVLTIISNPYNAIIFLGGRFYFSSGSGTTVYYLISEPIAIIVCFLAYTYLQKKLNVGAQFSATFLATITSGIVFMIMAVGLSPDIIISRMGSYDKFILTTIIRVIETAIINAIIVQILYTLLNKPIQTSFSDGSE